MVWNVSLEDNPNCQQGSLFPVMWPNTCVVEDFYSSEDDILDFSSEEDDNPPFINPPPSVSTTPFPTSEQI